MPESSPTTEQLVPQLVHQLAGLTRELAQLREELAQSRRFQAELIEALRFRSDREQQRYVSTGVAAQRLGKSRKTIRKMLDDGRLRGFKEGDTQQAQWLVDARSLEQELGMNGAR